MPKTNKVLKETIKEAQKSKEQEAIIVLQEAQQKRAKECAKKIDEILVEYGFQLKPVTQINLIPRQ